MACRWKKFASVLRAWFQFGDCLSAYLMQHTACIGRISFLVENQRSLVLIKHFIDCSLGTKWVTGSVTEWNSKHVKHSKTKIMLNQHHVLITTYGNIRNRESLLMQLITLTVRSILYRGIIGVFPVLEGSNETLTLHKSFYTCNHF